MFDDIISTPNIIRGVITAAIMLLIFQASRKKPPTTYGGAISLKMPKVYLIFGALTCVATLIVLIWGISLDGKNELWALLGIAVLGLGLGMPLVLMGMNFEIRISPDGVGQTTMLGHEKFIRWDEIKNVSFGIISKELKIRSAQHKIKAHEHLIGFSQLVDQLMIQTGKSRKELGLSR